MRNSAPRMALPPFSARWSKQHQRGISLGLTPRGSHPARRAKCLFRGSRFEHLPLRWSRQDESWLPERLWHGANTGLYERTLSCLQSWLSLKLKKNPFLKCPVPPFCAQARLSTPQMEGFLAFTETAAPCQIQINCQQKAPLSISGNVCVPPGRRTARCVSTQSHQPLLWGYKQVYRPTHNFWTNTPHSSGIWEMPTCKDGLPESVQSPCDWFSFQAAVKHLG